MFSPAYILTRSARPPKPIHLYHWYCFSPTAALWNQIPKDYSLFFNGLLCWSNYATVLSRCQLIFYHFSTKISEFNQDTFLICTQKRICPNIFLFYFTIQQILMIEGLCRRWSFIRRERNQSVWGGQDKEKSGDGIYTKKLNNWILSMKDFPMKNPSNGIYIKKIMNWILQLLIWKNLLYIKSYIDSIGYHL